MSEAVEVDEEEEEVQRESWKVQQEGEKEIDVVRVQEEEF